LRQYPTPGETPEPRVPNGTWIDDTKGMTETLYLYVGETTKAKNRFGGITKQVKFEYDPLNYYTGKFLAETEDGPRKVVNTIQEGKDWLVTKANN